MGNQVSTDRSAAIHAGRPPRIAFITAGLYFDATSEVTQLKFDLMSEIGEGDVYCVSWPGQQTVGAIDRFRIRALRLPRRLSGLGMMPSLLRSLAYSTYVLWLIVSERWLARRRYDLLIAIDPFKSGLLAKVASALTGACFAVEVNGNYRASMLLTDGAVLPWFASLKRRAALRIIPFVLKRAAGIKLLYEEQLRDLEVAVDPSRVAVFHDIIAASLFRGRPADKRFILFVGYPWHLKGVDVLIAAFARVAEEFPDVALKIVGWCEHPEKYFAMSSACSQIELMPRGVSHATAAELIGSCEFLVLPSRTEAMGRVLLEAMAAQKPVIGSRVDGIPRVIAHGSNGLLFEPEDDEDLANQIRRLLSDREYAGALGRRGRHDLESRFSPRAYIEEYEKLVVRSLRKDLISTP